MGTKVKSSRREVYKTFFERCVKRTGKWRGKKWDGAKLLGKRLDVKRNKKTINKK